MEERFVWSLTPQRPTTYGVQSFRRCAIKVNDVAVVCWLPITLSITPSHNILTLGQPCLYNERNEHSLNPTDLVVNARRKVPFTGDGQTEGQHRGHVVGQKSGWKDELQQSLRRLPLLVGLWQGQGQVGQLLVNVVERLDP